jgi:FkbM family methyltransferase
MLTAGIAANGFGNVTLRQCAVSRSAGTGYLSPSLHAELGALARGAAPSGATEAVSLVTLDDCLRSHGWRDVDFVKIDAEGEEAAILKGGERFFSELSPLVQYEVRASNDLHLELVQAFTALGYDSYRFVPGLMLLAPFTPDAPPDGYLLNLLGCKPDRAASLAARGFLVTAASAEIRQKPSLAAGADDSGSASAEGWQRMLAALPYGAPLMDRWRLAMAGRESDELARALSCYAASRDATSSAGKRLRALEASLVLLSTLCEREPSRLRLASLARVASEHGSRSLAVSALNRLADAIFRSGRIEVDEPFLAPCERFDAIAPAAVPGNWVMAAVLETLERLSAFSSFYTGESARSRLELIRDLGFASAEMRRRLDLVERRFGRAARQPSA